MKKLIISQFVVLLAGTIFAWCNFGYELHSWIKVGSCETGCAIGVTNPFLTPCFYGALVFTIAFILSAVMLKRSGSTSVTTF